MAREIDLGSIMGPAGPAGADEKTPSFELRDGHLFAIYE